MSATAWVVGGTGGIGGACATALASDGFAVHTSDRPAEDITVPGVADAVGAGMRAAGGFTAAVYTIGMSGRRLGDGTLVDCTDEAWDEVIRVDLSSAFRFVQACLRHAEDGSSVVLIGSALAGGFDGDFHTAAYRVAKAAMTPLLELAAYEGASRGVRFNMVSPGLVDTRMATRALTDERIQARFPELMPLTRRPATPAEVAAAVSWLVGDGSPQTTGAIIPVDGGWRLR
jgi:NAD(P)-dependent dehydrogenase (short-subunit alcohol dehydrogenase family)